MAVEKNQLIELQIDSLSSEGSGVGRWQGQAIFVPLTAPGDRVQVKIGKATKTYAYGILQKVLEPSPVRVEADCPVYRPCGGCQLRHITYAAELEQKQKIVQDCFSRLGGLEAPVLPILPSPLVDEYRNKVQFPVQPGPDGKPQIGFYAPRSHRLVPCGSCRLQPALLNEIAAEICRLMEVFSISCYDEASHTGLIRHIYLRRGWHSGQVLVCLVANGRKLPGQAEFCAALQRKFPAVTSIVLNVNTQKTNVITGRECIPLAGSGWIEDTMCGVPVRLGPLSFYQVNTPAAEQLYAAARKFAALQPADTLLDLYCGMGTIGLSMYADCARLIGVEVVDEAVASARRNAAAMGADNARFLCADAGQAAEKLLAEGLRPDVVVLDPPRKGCDMATLSAVVRMAPRRIVMVSCNPATAARDAKILAQEGYRTVKIQPADLFPRTKHVETIVQLCRENASFQ